MILTKKNDLSGHEQSVVKAIESIKDLPKTIDYLNDIIRTSIQFYNSGAHAEAEKKLLETFDILDLFAQVLFRCLLILEPKLNKNEELCINIKNLEIHLLGVIKGLYTAKEKRDIVMLCDLLEYELIDNLTKWKITTLSEITTTATTFP